MFEIKKSENITLIADKSIIYNKFENKEYLNIFKNIDKNVTIDLKNLDEYDSFAIYFIKEIEIFCEKNGFSCEIINQNEDFVKIYLKLSKYKKEQYDDNESNLKSIFENAGKRTLNLFKDFGEFTEFIGNVVINLLKNILFIEKVSIKEIGFLVLKNGVNALPIIVLILLLIGLISGYQGALQLKQFGADIYIADLIGVSVVRELSPLMVAIIVAGRSGSSFTAEIGTMKISDEIDALKTMGFNIFTYLVNPRIIALIFAVPILCLIGDIAGIIGGLIAATTTLNLTMNAYFTQLKTALTFAGIFSGVFKSFIFAFVIATIGCFRGLQVSGGAESVGRYTTSSVVSSIFMIILLDAIFTYIFQILNI
jgi:phospholipid/cholesterol/gamma-HCH transport system permease protein